MKIFLIGMPGSGKTTLGKELAAHLLIDFVDLDSDIEARDQRPIKDIFSQQGEAYFRMLEARLLRERAAGSGSFVMATGGGAPCFHQGMDVINEYGISIFLDCPVDVLMERVKANRERPLLVTADAEQLRQRLERMRADRLDCYRQAKIIISDPSLDAVIEKIEARR